MAIRHPYARQRPTFTQLADDDLDAHCFVNGSDKNGKSIRISVKMYPEPHALYSMRARTHIDLVRFSKSCGVVNIVSIEVIGKNTITTYVEGHPDPVKTTPINAF